MATAGEAAPWLALFVGPLERLRREADQLVRLHSQLLAHNDNVVTLAQRQAQIADNMAAFAAGGAPVPTAGAASTGRP